MQIESRKFDHDVFSALKTGEEAISQMSKQADIEAFEELKEQMEERMQESEEINEFFSGVA